MIKNKVEKKKFLGMEVRIVNDEFIVLKDMFSALGRLDSNGQIFSAEKNKLEVFLGDIGRICDSKTFTVTSKSSKLKSREHQDVVCLNISTVPIVLTQFKPTKAKGEEALEIWKKFMIFVNDILSSMEIYKYIITDKAHQNTQMDILSEAGGTPVITNNLIAIGMAKIIGVSGMVKKDELRKYQDQTTVDLLEVREYMLEKFVNAYEFTNSHHDSLEMALKLTVKKYKIEYLETAL